MHAVFARFQQSGIMQDALEQTARALGVHCSPKVWRVLIAGNAVHAIPLQPDDCHAPLGRNIVLPLLQRLLEKFPVMRQCPTDLLAPCAPSASLRPTLSSMPPFSSNGQPPLAGKTAQHLDILVSCVF